MLIGKSWWYVNYLSSMNSEQLLPLELLAELNARSMLAAGMQHITVLVRWNGQRLSMVCQQCGAWSQVVTGPLGPGFLSPVNLVVGPRCAVCLILQRKNTSRLYGGGVLS